MAAYKTVELDDLLTGNLNLTSRGLISRDFSDRLQPGVVVLCLFSHRNDGFDPRSAPPDDGARIRAIPLVLPRWPDYQGRGHRIWVPPRRGARIQADSDADPAPWWAGPGLRGVKMMNFVFKTRKL